MFVTPAQSMINLIANSVSKREKQELEALVKESGGNFDLKRSNLEVIDELNLNPK